LKKIVSLSESQTKRFRIAISYSGLDREFVKKVDQELLKSLDHTEVFYDQRYSALMARPDLDSWLRDLFRDSSDLVVCFLSQAHEQSPWCQVEINAVREHFQDHGQKAAPMLLTDGDFEVGFGFAKHHAQSTENLSPAEVADLILERFKHEHPEVTIKSRESGRKGMILELTLIAALIGGVAWFINDYDDGKHEDVVGVLGFGTLLIPFVWALFRQKNFLKPRERPATYIDPPTTAREPGVAEWENYARELESYVEVEQIKLTQSLHEMRQRRFISMAAIFLAVALALGHAIFWLEFTNNSDSAFLPPLTEESRKAGELWSFEDVLDRHPGHLKLAFLYMGIVAFATFIVSNRTRRPFITASYLGAWQPMYLGIIYVLFVSAYNYKGLFEAEKEAQGFYQEPGNFYVIERIVAVPFACWIVALVAGILGYMARGESKHQSK